MGFLSTTCNVCERPVGLNRFKIKAGWICPECLKKAGGTMNFSKIRDLPVEEIRDFINNYQNATGLVDDESAFKVGVSPNEATIRKILQEEDNSSGFRLDIHIAAAAKQVKPNQEIVYAFAGLASKWNSATSVVIVTSDGYIQIVSKGLITAVNLKVFKFSDIREFTMLNDIITNNICVETLTEHFCINVASSSKLQRIFNKLTELHRKFIENKEKENSKQSNPSLSIADELMKFKQLLDAGVITQDEFEKKKRDLLG